MRSEDEDEWSEDEDEPEVPQEPQSPCNVRYRYQTADGAVAIEVCRDVPTAIVDRPAFLRTIDGNLIPQYRRYQLVKMVDRSEDPKNPVVLVEYEETIPG